LELGGEGAAVLFEGAALGGELLYRCSMLGVLRLQRGDVLLMLSGRLLEPLALGSDGGLTFGQCLFLALDRLLVGLELSLSLLEDPGAGAELLALGAE